MAATTAVQGSPRAWTITLTIPRPPRIRWRWLAVAALIAGAVFVVALTWPAPGRPTPPRVPHQWAGTVQRRCCRRRDLLPRAAADPAPACPTQP